LKVVNLTIYYLFHFSEKKENRRVVPPPLADWNRSQSFPPGAGALHNSQGFPHRNETLHSSCRQVFSIAKSTKFASD
jgi:hypothetical protein